MGAIRENETLTGGVVAPPLTSPASHLRLLLLANTLLLCHVLVFLCPFCAVAMATRWMAALKDMAA